MSSGDSLRVFMCRHGHAEGNAARLLRSVGADPLTPLGMQQASLLAENLAGLGVTMVLTSPLRRAVETAEALSSKLGVAALQEDGLRERDYGEFDGLSIDAVMARRDELGHTWADPTQDWFGIPGVESDKSVAERAIETITHHGRAGTVAVITHAGVVVSVFRRMFGIEADGPCVLKIAHCGFLDFEIRPNGFVFHRIVRLD